MSTAITLDLGYGDFAIALYASSLPIPAPDLEGDTIAAYAEEGTGILGGHEAVRNLHAYWLRLNLDLIRSRISAEDHAIAMKRLWPDAERLERCIGYDTVRLLPH